MKNKLQLNNKTSLRQKLVFASLGIGLIVVVCILGFFYLNLGSAEQAIAAEGEGTCGIVISSEDTGYNQSFQPYKVKIEADILRVIPSSQSCVNGYNFNIEVAYNISFEGPGTPNINTLQGNIVCDNYNLFFEFPPNVKNNGGSGTFITTVNPWRGESDCSAITPETLGCDAITITIGGEGIPAQSNISCPKNILLPISLVDFKASKKEERIVIDWTTGSEINNDFFTLEHSIDGKVFENIATIEGAGNSAQLIDYKFEDKHPDQGMNYYRLKQTDYNGDFEYFKIVAVNFGGVDPEAISSNTIIVKEAYPNPFKNEIKLDFELSKAENIKVIIQNARGEVLYQEAISTNLGANNYTFTRADELKSGIYYINLKSDSENFKPQRIVKL